MPEIRIAGAGALRPGEKKLVKAGERDVLLIQTEEALVAVQPTCPHAGAPLIEGAVCNNRLVCPWHMGTFALPSGDLVEPPPLHGLDTYAVRVDGEDALLNPEPRAWQQPLAREATNARSFLLVGAGAACTMAAITLRNEGFAGHIVAVDPVEDEPIDRTQLSKQVLAGKMPLAKARLDALETLGVERVRASVTELRAQEATLSNGDTVAFDRALVATGGVPKRLEIPGAEKAFTLRHGSDVTAILAQAESGKHAVVVGTSFIGLEAASALTQKGLRVTVVGNKPEVAFAGKFGERVAAAIVALHKEKGVEFLLDTETVAVTPAGVRLQTSGRPEEVLACDLVVLGVGVAAELSFRHSLPVAAKGGLVTDDTLRVADNIFAAGDIANVAGTRIEHWRLAEQHGMLAARNMLGLDERFAGVPFFWTFHFGKRFGYLGHAEMWDEIVFDGVVEEFRFLAFFVKEGEVAAVLSCGRDHDTAALAEPMRQPQTLDALRAHLQG